MYGYIYKTTNNINGKIYIGKKKGKFDTYYLGSGKYLKRAVNKYGRKNFSVELLEECFSLDGQNEKEKYWISYFRKLNYEMYNIADGGDGGDIISCLPLEDKIKFKNRMRELSLLGITGNKDKPLTQEHKDKIGMANKDKKHSKEWVDKQRQKIIGSIPWNKGLTKEDERVQKYVRKKGTFHHSEETKIKISNKTKGVKKIFKNPEQHSKNLSIALKARKLSEKQLQRIRNIAKGRIWINNGEISKMIYENELETYLKQNYKLGRIMKNRKENTN